MKLLIISSSLKRVPVFKGIQVTTFKWEDKNLNDINLRDYDGVVIDISSLDKTTEKLADLSMFEQEQISNKIVLDVLNDENSFFFVVGYPLDTIENISLSYALGYEFTAINGKGSSLHPTINYDLSKFFNYFQTVKKYSYSFERIQPGPDMIYSTNHILSHEAHLVTRAGYPIDALITYESRFGGEPFFKGTLGFFPVSNTLDNDEAVELLVNCQLGDTPSEAPEWTSAISVFGQEELDTGIRKIKTQIEDLRQHLEQKKSELNQLRQPVEIIYKADKPLEDSIKTALRGAGVGIREADDGANKVEFFIEHQAYKMVVEVKSTKKEAIDQKGLRQVLDWQMDAFDAQGLNYKALVIVSNNILLLPEQRSSQILPDNLKDYAEQKKIAVVSVLVLFNVLQMIKRNEITVEDFLGRLNETDGIFELNESDRLETS